MESLWLPSAALALSAIFFRAAASGFRNLPALASAIDAYDVLRTGAGRYLAPLLALVELATGLLLLLPSTRIAGAIAASVLLAGFGFAIAVNVVRGTTDFDCGCDGAHNLRPGAGVLARNLFILLASIVIARSSAVPVDFSQCVVAAALLLAWHATNAMIAALQWPRDD